MRAVRTKRADGTEAIYWYCRQTGARLPDINDPGFGAALAKARSASLAKFAAGTLGALLNDWRRSQEWAASAENTKTIRDRYLRWVEVPDWQNRQVIDLAPAAFRQLRAELLEARDELAADRGPGAGNVFGVALASLFAWAVDRGKMAISPLTRLKTLQGGHIPPWTEEQAQHAMTTWPEHLRRAVFLNYHLGQRRGDLVDLLWTQYNPTTGIIRLQPEKTRRKREAKGKGPMHLVVSSALAWELRRWRDEAPEGEHVLTKQDGHGWTRGALSMAVREQIQREQKANPAMGWNTKCGLHGLRKLLAISLKEIGSSDGEIGAAQGWESERTVRLYTEGANQEKMARAAIDRREKAVSKGVKTG